MSEAVYRPEQRRALARAVAQKEAVTCPACGARVTVNHVDPGPRISYVRQRVLVICSSCHRSAAIDVGNA